MTSDHPGDVDSPQKDESPPRSPSGRVGVIASFLLWQGAWFSAVGGAGSGEPILGSIGAVILILVSLRLRKALRSELAFVAVAVALGFAIDSALVLIGFLDFPDAARLAAPSTVWMALLWGNLAAHLGPGSAFGWIEGRTGLAVGIGATSGPLAYYGGTKLGAVILVEPMVSGLVALAVIWGIGFPALFWVRTRIRALTSSPKPRVRTL